MPGSRSKENPGLLKYEECVGGFGVLLCAKSLRLCKNWKKESKYRERELAMVCIWFLGEC